MLKRRFCTLGLLCFFLMSQVFASSWETIAENNIQEIFTEEEVILLEEGQSIDQQVVEDEEIEEIEEEIVIPEFNIIFQNPSYILEKDLIKNEYFCDPEKDICKINIKLTDLWGGDIWNDFLCEIKYSHSFETDNRCNPTTFILDQDIEIHYKVFEKNNPENYKEKKVNFKIQENIAEETINDNEHQEDEENTTWSGSVGEEVGNEEIENENWEENKTWTWSQENTWSWVIETGSWEIEKEDIILPIIILEVQSGLDYSGTWNIYTCQKEECKINLDVTESFTWIFLEKKYECNWDFWSGVFSSSNTDKKCNPWYVNYWTGIYEVSIKVIEKDNFENFISKIFYIHNTQEEGTEWLNEDTENVKEKNSEDNEEQESSETTDSEENINENAEKEKSNTWSWTIDDWEEENTGSWVVETWTWEIEHEELFFPEIVLKIQSWLEYSGTWNTYTCEKEKCKINLDISESFTWFLEESDYLCEWNFWSWSFKTSNTDKKCNPWYVEFSIGIHEVWMKILDKNNNDHYIEKIIYIENKIKVIPNIVVKKSSWWGSYWYSNKSIIDVTINKKIEVQSWLNSQNTCNKELCKINLKYNNSSYETCEWTFWNIEVKESYITSCNPGFIYYLSWKYNISLRIRNNKVNTIHTKILEITNIYIKSENSDDKEEWEGILEWKIKEIEEIKKKIIFDIELQGKQVDYKKYIWDKIICFWVDECNINLKTKHSTKYLYYWNFDNGELSTKSNPAAVWYNSGSYVMNLVIKQKNIEIFTKNISVEVIPPEIPENQKILAQEFITELDKQDNLIFQISENISVEEFTIENIRNKIQRKNLQNLLLNTQKYNKNLKKEISKKAGYILQPKQYISWFEEKNKVPKLKLTRNISKQKKALKYSWITLPNSTVFIVQWDNIIELQSDKSGKYELKQKELIVGNYDLEYYVLDENGNFFESKKVKNLILDEEYVAQINNYNKNQKYLVKSTKKKKYITKIANKKYIEEVISNTEYASIIPNIQTEKTRWESLFQILLILLSLFWTSILLKKYKIL